MSNKKFKVDDRVKRTGSNGSYGTVKAVRAEVATALKQEDRSLMIQVLWDNGTLSYSAPESLELAKE